MDKNEKKSSEENKFLKEKIMKLKEIRINNTLSSFKRKNLLMAKEKIEEVRNYLINPDYSKIASIIIDGNLKAASENHIIFIYSTERLSEEYNKNILEIDKLLSLLFEKEIYSIATDKDSWEIIKKEFNNKEKEYKYIEEPDDLEKFFQIEKENETVIDETFGNLVEYS